MKGSYLQIILIFAIFLLPEIIKILKKRNPKKYEYPDEQPYEAPKTGRDDTYNKQPEVQTQPDLWDILTGRAQYQQVEEPPAKIEEQAPEPIKTKKMDEQSVAPMLATPKHACAKISAKSAARGLIMAEILGKPRALRPITRELPVRREYR